MVCGIGQIEIHSLCFHCREVCNPNHPNRDSTACTRQWNYCKDFIPTRRNKIISVTQKSTTFLPGSRKTSERYNGFTTSPGTYWVIGVHMVIIAVIALFIFAYFKMKKKPAVRKSTSKKKMNPEEENEARAHLLNGKESIQSGDVPTKGGKSKLTKESSGDVVSDPLKPGNKDE